jgi:hypothetical protein
LKNEPCNSAMGLSYDCYYLLSTVPCKCGVPDAPTSFP